MGQCVSEEKGDYDIIKPYNGDKFLCYRHGEGTYNYSNGDTYEGQWKWNKRHGHGVYTPRRGEKKEGYFYEDDFIGKDPGSLFASTSCFSGCNSAKPLEDDEHGEIIRNQEQSDAMKEKLDQSAKDREKWKKGRDDIAKKYNIVPKSTGYIQDRRK